MGGPSNHRFALYGLDEHPDDLAEAIISPLAAQLVGEFAEPLKAFGDNFGVEVAAQPHTLGALFV